MTCCHFFFFEVWRCHGNSCSEYRSIGLGGLLAISSNGSAEVSDADGKVGFCRIVADLLPHGQWRGKVHPTEKAKTMCIYKGRFGTLTCCASFVIPVLTYRPPAIISGVPDPGRGRAWGLSTPNWDGTLE